MRIPIIKTIMKVYIIDLFPKFDKKQLRKCKQIKLHSLEGVYAVGDPIFSRDLLLVVELPSDDRGRRSSMGRKITMCGRRIKNY